MYIVSDILCGVIAKKELSYKKDCLYLKGCKQSFLFIYIFNINNFSNRN